jgi:hypothetical protein
MEFLKQKIHREFGIQCFSPANGPYLVSPPPSHAGVSLEIDCSLHVPVELSSGLLKRTPDDGAHSSHDSLLLQFNVSWRKCDAVQHLTHHFGTFFCLSLCPSRIVSHVAERACSRHHDIDAVMVCRGREKIKVQLFVTSRCSLVLIAVTQQLTSTFSQRTRLFISSTSYHPSTSLLFF